MAAPFLHVAPRVLLSEKAEEKPRVRGTHESVFEGRAVDAVRRAGAMRWESEIIIKLGEFIMSTESIKLQI